MHVCDFYVDGIGNSGRCAGKDFLCVRAGDSSDSRSAMTMYLTMFPTLALFTIGSRTAHLVGSLIGGAFLIAFVATASPRFVRVVSLSPPSARG